MENIKDIKKKIENLKVLFVEDEEDVLNMTKKLLSKFFINVFTAKDGQEGIDIFEEEGFFDIVITDIKMPILDGISMLKKLKQQNENLFCVFITASKGQNEIELGLANMTLMKPVDFEDILKLIEAIYKNFCTDESDNMDRATGGVEDKKDKNNGDSNG